MNEKLNVLHFPTRYFPAISGAEFYFQRLSEILNEKIDVSIDVFCSNALDFSALKQPEGKRVVPKNKYFNQVNGLKIKRFPIDYNLSIEEQIDLIENTKGYVSLNLSREVLRNIIKNGPNICEVIANYEKNMEKRYDLIHTTYIPYLNVLLSLILGKTWDIPTICTPFFHFTNPRYQNSYYTEILKKFDLVLCCTSLEKQYLINEGIESEKICIVPMGIDLEIYENTQTINFKEQYFGKAKQNLPMLLFCGYKNYEKGALSLLRAIPHLTKKDKNLLFTFIGPSTEAFNIELGKIKKKNKAVNIINLSPSNLSGYYDKKKISAFKECEIYVMPSRSDAFGIAFLEAWAFKKPVIGANIGATPEIVNDGKNGLLVQFDSTRDICNKINYLLENKERAKLMGSSGYEKIKEKNYYWQSISKKIFKIYNSIIETNNSN